MGGGGEQELQVLAMGVLKLGEGGGHSFHKNKGGGGVFIPPSVSARAGMQLRDHPQSSAITN